MDYKRFKENQIIEATRVAKEFIESIQRAMGRIEIEKVNYNDDIDIRNIVITYM